MPPPTIVAVGRTDVGLARENNEDGFFVGPSLAVVADGVGGSVAGELASQTVVDVFAALPPARDGEDLGHMLTAAVAEASERIRDLTAAAPDLAGMGTTVTAMAWAGDRLVLAQVGDSRCYLLPAAEPRKLAQVTKDDSYVQYLVDAGRITAEQAAVHPRRNVILRAVDGTPVEPTITTLSLIAGDRYLLCSDGLSDYVPQTDWRRVLADIADAAEAADALIDLSLAVGAPDNVTVIVADVIGSDCPAA